MDSSLKEGIKQKRIANHDRLTWIIQKEKKNRIWTGEREGANQ